MAMNTQDEEIWLQYVARIAEEIQQRPVDRLLPFATQIDNLLSIGKDLSSSVIRRRPSETQAVITSSTFMDNIASLMPTLQPPPSNTPSLSEAEAKSEPRLS